MQRADSLLQDSFYNPLTPEQSAVAFRNEFDFDAPEAIDFDLLVKVLADIQAGYDLSLGLSLDRTLRRETNVRWHSQEEGRRTHLLVCEA
jgi:hypothetical protein